MSLPARLRHAHPVAPVVVGFDGFIDEVTVVVDRRTGPEAWTPMTRLGDFAALVGQAAGRSATREIVVREAPGGCAMNLGDGLAAAGVAVHAFATLGDPVHPAFAAMTDRFAGVHTWGGMRGRTIAMEFTDGKLLLPCVQPFAGFTPALVARLLADGAYARACAQAGAIALTDWALFPHMTAVWRLLHDEVFRHLTHRPLALIDLVDPAGRSRADLAEALALLRDLNGPLEVHLSCNRNEARQVGEVLGLTVATDDGPILAETARTLHQALGIAGVVIHAHRTAAAADATGAEALAGPHTPTPRISTGAGDRFNSGWLLGALHGGHRRVRLACATGLAGFYVRQARSPTAAELADFLATSFPQDFP